MKWHLPLGLLYDLFSGNTPTSSENPELPWRTRNVGANGNGGLNLPWRLVLHFSDWPDDQLLPLDIGFKSSMDTFMNSVKEADFLRNGTGKAIKSLSKDDSTNLWKAVRDHDQGRLDAIHHKLLKSLDGAQIRHIPMKVYLPSKGVTPNIIGRGHGTVRTVQGLVSPTASSREPQTIGTALHDLLPTVFPSRQSYIHAQATLHGATVPPAAPMLELLQNAAFPDGFLHVVIVMVNHGAA